MKKRKILTIIALALLVTASFQTGKMIANKLSKSHTVQQIQTEINQKEVNLTGETVAKELIDKLELQVLDIQFSTNGKIDKGSNSLFGIFKNVKHIKFYGNARYSIDFTLLKTEQVRVNENDIKIYLSKPVVDVDIHEKMTEFKDEKGALVFGDLECTPEEMVYLTSQAKENIYNEAMKSENINEATSRAEEKVKEVISLLTKNNYKIEIIWT